MADTIKIGWGRRSLAPEQPVPIQGQFYLRVSLGSYTPVSASCLVLESGGDLAAFVSCDMVSVNPDVLLRTQEILKQEIPGFPAEKIIINATHTHAGPGSNDPGEYPGQMAMLRGAELRAFLARQIADAVKEAWETRSPGAVACGYGFATTGHSRRVIYSEDISLRSAARPGIAVDGHGKMYGNTDDPLFSHYEAGTDAFIDLLYTFDGHGKLTGAVIDVPCPAQTNEHAWMLHAGFWHHVREKLHALYGDIGVVGQAAAAGDLSPRQLHYREAELRRYRLKYPEQIARYMADPMKIPVSEGGAPDPEAVRAAHEKACLDFMRAEDISSRIVAAFQEVLEWAGREKFTAPEFRHEVRTVKLARRMFPEEIMEEEKRNSETFSAEPWLTEGDKWEMLRNNSTLFSRRNRCSGVVNRYRIQEKEPDILTDVHVVRIGNIAFATNRFELFMDYMHRIRARSPFEQTFIVQLTADPRGSGSYLATERAQKNKGYSASPYCNQVSPEGGQQLVEETLKILEELK